MAGQNSSSFDCLPTEILVEIASYFTSYKVQDQKLHPRLLCTQDLLKLRLTNKRLLSIVTPFAFRRIRLHGSIQSAETQSLGLSTSPLVRHVRRLVISSSCAIPIEASTAFRDDFDYTWHKRGARALFVMRQADRSGFPTLLLDLFRAVRDNLTSLKIIVGDVVPNYREQDYSKLYMRTVSFALRNLELPRLSTMSFFHPNMQTSGLQFTREIRELAQVPVQPDLNISFTEGTWIAAPPPPVYNRITSLCIKLDSLNMKYYTGAHMGSLLSIGFSDYLPNLEELRLSLLFPTHEVNNLLYAGPADPDADPPAVYAPKKLKRLSIQGYFNIPNTHDLQTALSSLKNLENLHLRGVYICFHGLGTSNMTMESWAPFFNACAENESLVNVRFECLSSYYGNLRQNFSQDSCFRMPVDDTWQKTAANGFWINEIDLWRPIFTKRTEELDALGLMREAVVGRRRNRGLPRSNWLEKCGLPEVSTIDRMIIPEE